MVRTGPGEGTSYRGRVHSPHRSIGGHSSGSQYALCTLGVGLVALGVVMIVWTVVPLEPVYNVSSIKPSDGSLDSRGKTSSVAFVLLAVGLAMLLLAICLALRNKRRQRVRDPHETNSSFLRPTEGAADAMEEAPSYDVPSYEEAVGSGQYPVRQSNLRASTSQLPSYEDLVAAVQNEAILQEAPGPASAPAPTPAPTNPAPAPAAARRSGRSSRLLRPLLARRIKSEKLSREMHLDIQSLPPGGQVTIEPLTPPPQYEEKTPEL